MNSRILARAGLFVLAILAARAAFAAITLGAPTITPWRDNATSAYSIVHDDVCDFSTPGVIANWQEVLPRGLKLAWAAIGGQCPQTTGSLTMLNDMVAAGQEVASHSMQHCKLTQSSCAAYPGFTTTDYRTEEMLGSRTYLQSVLPAGTTVSFYAFPFDAYNTSLLTQVQGFGYLGARGGVRPGVGGHPVNSADINPVTDSLVDFKVQYDVYDTDDSGANASTYAGPYTAPTFTSLTAYLNDVVALGGWGVQELHGIGDTSYGNISLAIYRLHLDDLVTRQNNRQVWVATPTEVIKYRRTRYHCGPITQSGTVLTFAGAANASCIAYATTVTVKIPVTSGEAAIAAKQGTAPDEKWLRVRAGGAGNFFVDANPLDGPITVVDAVAPAITSASATTFTVGAAGNFAVTATGTRSPTLTSTALPSGVTLASAPGTPASATTTGALAGTPTTAGVFTLSLIAANDAAPSATQDFTLTVVKGTQTISFGTLANVQLGAPAFTVSAVGGSSTSPVTFSATGSCSGGGANGATITPSVLGACTVVASQLGDANYLDAAPVTRTFEVIDTTAPQTQITSVNPAITNSVSAAFTFVGTDNSNLGVSFECSLDGVAFAACVSPQNPTGLGEGSHTFAVRAKDSSGNVDLSPATFSWTVDFAAPTIGFTSRPTITQGNQTSYVVSGTCSEDGRTVSVQIGSIATNRACGAPVSGQFVTSGINVASLAQGPVTLQASITDLAGNTTAVTDSTTKDTVGPSLTIASLVAITTSNQGAYGFSGSCEAGGGSVGYTLVSGGSVTGTVSCVSGAYAVTGLDVSSLADSLSIAFTITQADALANTSTTTGSTVKDTINPSLTIDAPQPINGENQGGYAVAGDCSETGRNITVTVGPVGGAGPLIATATCGAPVPGRYVADGFVVPRALPEGNVPLSATMTDVNGNSATAVATAVKGTTPDVLLFADINPANTADTVTFTATLDDYSQIHLPTGVVVFKSGGTPITGCASQAINSAGVYALCFFSPGVGGTFAITAEYLGDGNYNPAASAVLNEVVQALVGPPTQIAINAGNNQTSTVGTTVATRPSAVVRDANNNPVAGVLVTFAVAGGGGSVTGATPTTNALGVATVGNWTLGTAAGTNNNTLHATSAGLSGSPLTFTASALAGAASQIAINSGNNQNATAGTPVATAPSVVVRDAHGNPVSGVPVTFAVAGGGGNATGGVQATNASGVATVGSWTLGTTAGSSNNTLSATSTGLSGSPITFTASALAGAASQIAINSGNNQTAIAGNAVATAPSVIVRDVNGNAVSGATVSFAAASGGGNVTAGAQATNASGVATVGSWTLGPTAGTNNNTLSATSTGLSGSPITFTASAVAGPASQIAINAGDNQTSTAGTAVPVAPSVVARDAHGNPVSGVPVTFAVATGGGSLTGGTQTTSVAGIATVGSWTLGPTGGTGNNTLTATSNGLIGSPVAFIASGITSPTISSPTVAGPGPDTATLGASVTSNGGSPVTLRGLVYAPSAANPNPLIGGASVTLLAVAGSTGVFTSGVAGLSPGTAYSFKGFATNAVGTSYTSVATFVTLTPPGAITNPADSVTRSAAVVRGTVNPNGSETTASFDYGLTTSYGSQAPAAPAPGTGSSPVSVSASLAGLACSTTYHFRSTATSAAGTTHGSDAVFDTLPCATPFLESFEGANPWTGWGLTTGQYHSATHSLTDSPGGNYASLADDRAVSPVIDLAGLAKARLTFWHKFDLGAGDFGNVWVQDVLTLAYTQVAAFSGSRVDWQQEAVSLDAFVGKEIRIVLQVSSDAAGEADGWYVDDLAVESLPLPALSIQDAATPEGYTSGSTMAFSVSLSEPAAWPVTVQWATQSTPPPASATPGVDYTTASGALVFAPGETRKIINVAVIGDAVSEPNETFVVTLSGAAGATIVDGSGTGTILNDDGPTLSVTDYAIAEGTGGTPHNLLFTVVLSQASDQTITVDYATANGTATAGSDYTAASGTITLPPGATSQVVSVPITPDALVEPDETVLLNLSNATNATIFDSQGVGTIVADDGLLVSIADKTIVEGNAGFRPMSFKVSLSAPAPGTVTVAYATADGTATAPLDYTAATGTVTFIAGESSKTITIQVVGDLLQESHETFFVNLSAPTGGLAIGDGQAQGTIINTDGHTDRSRLMFHNFVTNRLYRWHLKNGNFIDTFNWVTPWATDPGWTVGAVADFDQDPGAQLDYLWHNIDDGRLLYWYVDGDNLRGYQFAPYIMGPPWRLATTFDADGNGTQDVVFYNSSTGVLHVWLQDNATVLGQYDITTTLPGAGTLRVVASGDVDGDGADELILYNSATGQILAWKMSGPNVMSTITYPDAQSTAQAYNLVSTRTDFNSDGQPDFLWHNPTPTGIFSVWFMDGTTKTGTGVFLPFTATDPVWRVVGSANIW